jgi:predicted ester cyclase
MVFSEILNGGRQELLDDLIDPAYVEYNPVPGQLPGAEGIRKKLEAFMIAFPDLRFVREDCIAEGDLVAAWYYREGTQEGDFFGIPITGRKVSVAGMDFTGSGTKNRGARDRVDMQGLMKQLGRCRGNESRDQFPVVFTHFYTRSKPS